MKPIKLITAALLAFTVASTASAQTIIRLAGGNATRVAALTAIENLMGGPGTFKAAYLTGSSVTSEKDAIVGVISGNIAGVGAVTIKYNWLGAIGGTKTLVQNNALANSWMASVHLPASNGIVGIAAPTYDSAATADANFTDVFQSSTAFPTPTLVSQIVGVLPYQWVRCAGAPSTMSNLTAGQAYNLLGGGLPLSQLTAKTADQAAAVYVFGRDESAGLRFEAFGESGFGAFGSPQQYQATISGGVVTNYVLYPTNTVLGVTYSAGHSGYSSGGTLATTLNTPITGTVGAGTATATNSLDTWFIGYLAATDVAKVTNGAPLSWNGVPYSALAVQEGTYTCWSYDHVEYRTTYSGLGKTTMDKIAKQVHDQDIAAGGVGLLVGSMSVGRTGDGGTPVTFGNPY